MSSSPRSLIPLVLLGLAAQATAQVPTTQPQLLTIFMEEVKLGRQVEHTANEAGWPAAFARAGSRDYYLAMEAITGTNEVWYVASFESHAREGEAMKLAMTDPALSAELARLSRTDAEYLTSLRTVKAVARPDLSHGAFPDMGRQRFWEITTVRMRSGMEAQFDSAVKTFGRVAQRVAPDVSFRVYIVTAGMPSGTYLIFSSVTDYAQFDKAMSNDMAMGNAMTAKERAVFDALSPGIISAITNRYRLSPTMSFVDDQTKAADPAFWNGK